jgi:heme/copper-type cytochrome/quinol oxidase subunit 2
MNCIFLAKRCLAGLTALGLLAPLSSPACTACFGRSDSPLAEGMNWGILSLLGVIGFVLMSVAVFFVYLARRAAAQGATSAPSDFPGAAPAFSPSE